MKRFTETCKWRDPWFRRLSPTSKLVWLYLTDHCDCTGTIDFDLEAASFDVGATVKEQHLAELGDRVQRLESGKLFIPRFITFQYGHLSESCPAHKPVLKLIHERNISINGIGYQYPIDRVSVEYPYSTGKGKDKEKDKEGGVRGGFCKPSLGDLLPILPASQATDFLDHYESNGWKVGRNPMKDWKAAARKWGRNSSQFQFGKSEPQMSPQQRQERINHLNKRKQEVLHIITDPLNPPSWAEKELSKVDAELQKL